MKHCKRSHKCPYGNAFEKMYVLMGEPTDVHYPSWYAERLEHLPSAQPDVTGINVGDMVSRQAAIEALQGRK